MEKQLCSDQILEAKDKNGQFLDCTMTLILPADDSGATECLLVRHESGKHFHLMHGGATCYQVLGYAEKTPSSAKHVIKGQQKINESNLSVQKR